MEMFSTTWLARLFAAAASGHVRCIVVCYVLVWALLFNSLPCCVCIPLYFI